MPRVSRSWAIAAATLVTCVGLFAHAAHYRFLTDDAFISFRYARNFSEGLGLVFNPGRDPVEGYTNLLWVLVLALAHRLGVAIPAASEALGLVATLALWALVVAYARRRCPADTRAFWCVVPPAFLAATRSVAIWSTSGLETRLFETLIVGAAFRAIVEVEARRSGRGTRPWSAALLALACLTRPDGVLIAACTLGATAFCLRAHGKLDRRFVAAAFSVGAVVAAHTVWRHAYYGYWLPNTFYAKVSHPWWSLGWRYLAAAALEYGALLWIPAAIVAVTSYVRTGMLHVPLLLGAIVLPHAVWVLAIGGDHFEFRPLDLYFPLVYFVLADALASFVSTSRRSLVAAAWAIVAMAGVVVLPLESHRQFPATYVAGYPGRAPHAEAFLDPNRSVVTRLPLVRAAASAHRRLLVTLTRAFVGVRQEEHALFLAGLEPEARKLASLAAQGVLPRDTHVALACVGVLPYATGFRTLDIHGLTDETVAHGPVTERVMAHEKVARPDLGPRLAVDFWSWDYVHLLFRRSDPAVRSLASGVGGMRMTPGVPPSRPPSDLCVADVGEGWVLVAHAVQGIEAVRARMPRLSVAWAGSPNARRMLARETP